MEKVVVTFITLLALTFLLGFLMLTNSAPSWLGRNGASSTALMQE